MSVPQMEPLRRTDFAFLAVYCLLLFGYALIGGRVLTTHESVHCLNSREMRHDHDWVIPHYGGRPWLERPPLPFWLTVAGVEVLGDADWVYRVPPLVMGMIVVFLTAWMGSVWFGRGIGLLTGLILATMGEFASYSTGPEADIFLCTIVTAAIALFVRLEFQLRPAEPNETVSLFGRRPWALLGFFVVLALTNLAKGLFFGDLFVLIPVAVFLMWNLDFTAIRRYIWLPGWLAFLIVAAAWPVAAYLRCPGIIDLWVSDYAGRVNQGYMKEPFWYYFANWPLVVFPWTLPALVGIWQSRGAAWRERYSQERFLWCWALAPLLFFSIPEGKHHHYLLQCIAPWSVLAALGATRLWEMVLNAPRRLSHPLWSFLVLGVPGDVALLAFGAKLPGPGWLVPALLVGWPIACFAFWWAVVQPRGKVAIGATFALLLAVHCLTYAYRSHYLDRYEFDSVFLQQARALVPADKQLMISGEEAPLNASWILYYVGSRAAFLHNLTFLRDERIADPEVYLIGRAQQKASLESYGSVEVMLQSEHTRAETSPGERYTLFRLHYRDGLQRKPGNVPISPMQATGRAQGPYLE
jgi:4-amino-4-deoxy-L-arabinose transferase-like glycosyltransferase